MKKIIDFFYFSKIVGYVFVGELFLLGIASVVGVYVQSFGEKFLKFLFYSYIFALPEKLQQYFFASCTDFGCVLPPFSVWGRALHAIIILGTAYFIACLIQFLLEKYTEHKDIKLAKDA